MIRIRYIAVSVVLLGLAACASDGSFDPGKAAAIGAGVLAAGTLDEKDVKEMSAEAAKTQSTTPTRLRPPASSSGSTKACAALAASPKAICCSASRT